MFAKEDFELFEEEYEEVASHLHKYPEPCYFPIKFHSARHQISSTMAKDYLNLLTDADPYTGLKSLQSVKVFNDGSVLFRTIPSLLGFSPEENVLELRLRCLLHAVSNLDSCTKEYRELQRGLRNSEQANIKNWSNFVHEKDHT